MRESGFDIQRVIELIAERKIEEAMQEGKFDDLPGKGKPLPLDEEWFAPPELRQSEAHTVVALADAEAQLHLSAQEREAIERSLTQS